MVWNGQTVRCPKEVPGEQSELIVYNHGKNKKVTKFIHAKLINELS